MFIYNFQQGKKMLKILIFKRRYIEQNRQTSEQIKHLSFATLANLAALFMSQSHDREQTQTLTHLTRWSQNSFCSFKLQMVSQDIRVSKQETCTAIFVFVISRSPQQLLLGCLIAQIYRKGLVNQGRSLLELPKASKSLTVKQGSPFQQWLASRELLFLQVIVS